MYEFTMHTHHVPGRSAASLRGLYCLELLLRPLLLATAGESAAVRAASIDMTSAMLLPLPLLQSLQLLRNRSPICTQRLQAAISRSAPVIGIRIVSQAATRVKSALSQHQPAATYPATVAFIQWCLFTGATCPLDHPAASAV